MDAGVIIAIVVGALILVALLWLLGRKSRERRYETRRAEAREIRRDAEVGRAEADAQAAEARRQEALARERSHEAEERHREARERHLEAARRDPDVDERQAAEEWDREHATTTGTTSRDSDADLDGDRSVDHYESTTGPDAERERRFTRDEEGNVLRDEEHERTRER